VAEPVGDDAMQRSEFLGALDQMQRQVDMQRIAALQVRQVDGTLDAEGKAQLRELLSAKSRGTPAT
jgi:hypothetical protein